LHLSNWLQEDAPASKKRKSEPKQKKALSSEAQKDDDGNDFWELSGKRRATISEFKKITFVNIREYYEKDGKTLPGKKGISLTMEQFTALLGVLPDIERALKSKGVEVPRPQYDKSGAAGGDEVEAELEEDEEEKASGKPKSKGKLDKFKIKSNHEATSDEDEDED
jgi:hypothetical protein